MSENQLLIKFERKVIFHSGHLLLPIPIELSRALNINKGEMFSMVLDKKNRIMLVRGALPDTVYFVALVRKYGNYMRFRLSREIIKTLKINEDLYFKIYLGENNVLYYEKGDYRIHPGSQ